MTPQEAYLERVNQFVSSLSAVLTAPEKARVDHLIQHGEPPEGLLTLAWIIHNEHKVVSKQAVADLIRLTGGLILTEDFPPDFENYGDS
jgi:hypothetical protein